MIFETERKLRVIGGCAEVGKGKKRSGNQARFKGCLALTRILECFSVRDETCDRFNPLDINSRISHGIFVRVLSSVQRYFMLCQ